MRRRSITTWNSSSEASITSASETRPVEIDLLRENERRLLTIRLMRSTSLRMLSSTSWYSRSFSRRLRISMLKLIAPSGLFNSCAIPAERMASELSFSERTSCCSRRRCDEMSTSRQTTAASSACPTPQGENVIWYVRSSPPSPPRCGDAALDAPRDHGLRHPAPGTGQVAPEQRLVALAARRAPDLAPRPGRCPGGRTAARTSGSRCRGSPPFPGGPPPSCAARSRGRATGP